jgi:hypothetical protein
MEVVDTLDELLVVKMLFDALKEDYRCLMVVVEMDFDSYYRQLVMAE